MNHYRKEINSLYTDGKLDKNDIGSLDDLKGDIAYDYAKGRLSEQQHGNLKDEISALYEEIYNKKLRLLNGMLYRKDDEYLEDIKEDIANAYAKGKISKQHYELLKEKISDYKITQNSIDKLSSFQGTGTSTMKGSPIKANK